MRKVLVLLGALFAFSTVSAQKLDVKLSTISQPQPELLYVWQDSGMRTGLATPCVDLSVNSKSLARISLWTVTPTNNWDDALFVGFGVSIPLYQTNAFSLSVAGGWNTSFKDMTIGEVLGIRRDDGYSVGLQLRYRM